MAEKLKARNIMKHFYGISNDTALFLQKEHLCKSEQWRKFVDIYRAKPDGENQGWRGEFWGKMMRGAALVCEYTQDEALYNVLCDTVRDMMSTAEPDGRVSSYSRDTEFDSWDLWGRKYVILGCEYFLDICRDESFKNEIVTFISRCADYILAHIGVEKEITRASRSWYGLNSTSILEPMVKLYNLTADKRYLDFCDYIVGTGGAEGINIFELAYENKLYPYQYGVSKAYEMTSCFEGLLEYYYVTGIEKYKNAVINYARAVLDSEMSIIGSCGVTHELFDHTKTRQTVRFDDGQQETCVTVTMMKFFARLLDLTGDSIYADAIEKSFYNAYLGALNSEHSESAYVHNRFSDRKVINTDLPFDSYSPLIPGKRARLVGGTQLLMDNSYYGCCACIGAAGVGIFLKNAVVVKDGAIVINFFESGRVEAAFNGIQVALDIETDYPKDSKVRISVSADSACEFEIRFRNPAWAENGGGYTVYKKAWKNDVIEIIMDMPIRIHYPIKWDEDLIYTDTSNNPPSFNAAGPMKVYHKAEEDNYFAVTRGPVTLAADSRIGKDPYTAFVPTYNAEICENSVTNGIFSLLKAKFTPENGEEFYLIDYAHAGRDWESTIAAWLPMENKE